jgi:hypothetical protein
MLIATGPGKGEIRPAPRSFLLFNFDIDGDNLKEEHKAFLRREVLPSLRGGSRASIIGLADRSGTAGHNQTLSTKRVVRTIEFLRAELPGGLNLKQAEGFGEKVAELEKFKDGDFEERFRAVVIFLSPKIPTSVTKTKIIDITAKSFIGFIGPNIGFVPGMDLPALTLMATVMDKVMNEDPRTPIKNKGYRLFSRCTFNLVFRDNKIIHVGTTLVTDTGKEGPFQAPPLQVTPVTVTGVGDSVVKFSWTGKGRPHPAVEPSFTIIKPRTSVFIWHKIEGEIDVSTGFTITKASITGSQFPSHRLFVDNVIVSTDVQGDFANLWVPDSADRTKVK